MDNPEINRFKTTNEWYKKLKREGYQIPLTLYYTLDRMVKEEHYSFQKAYQELSDDGRIKIINKEIVFDLNKHKIR